VDATPRTSLSWGSTLLHGLYSNIPASFLGEAALLGFSSPLQRIKHRRSTAVPVSRSGSPAPFQVGIPPEAPKTSSYGATLGFLNLPVTSSLHCRPTIFRWVTLLGFRPSGVFPLAQLRTAHRRQLALVTLLPRSIASVLSGSFLGHAPLLRSSGHAIRRLQGLRPRENRSSPSATFNVKQTDLPLLGFCLLMV